MMFFYRALEYFTALNQSIMPKIAKELSALAVGRLKTQGSYAVGKVAGLYLNVGANPQARNRAA